MVSLYRVAARGRRKYLWRLGTVNTIEREESFRGHVSADECSAMLATMRGEGGNWKGIILIIRPGRTSWEEKSGVGSWQTLLRKSWMIGIKEYLQLLLWLFSAFLLSIMFLGKIFSYNSFIRINDDFNFVLCNDKNKSNSTFYAAK